MRDWLAWWQKLHAVRDADDDSIEDELAVSRLFVRHALRLTVVFCLLFGAVFLVFKWSGAAVRFSALRAAGEATPTWKVHGVVRDAATREPIPWARVEDDPAGQPPLFSTEADQSGVFELSTLAEPHRVRVSAPN